MNVLYASIKILYIACMCVFIWTGGQVTLTYVCVSVPCVYLNSLMSFLFSFHLIFCPPFLCFSVCSVFAITHLFLRNPFPAHLHRHALNSLTQYTFFLSPPPQKHGQPCLFLYVFICGYDYTELCVGAPLKMIQSISQDVLAWPSNNHDISFKISACINILTKPININLDNVHRQIFLMIHS